MKTVQDWGFISKEQGLVKPKLQDNKIFHALTTAYENNQQQEIYGATENIVRREKELCELALADLKKLSSGKGEHDGTVKLVIDHYQSRLELAREKEEKINHISEDSRKMMEEYKKRTQELAEVKRNLMESQSKLRELAKNTERLIKKEEELRFIENNLRTELDQNKRNIINGLYEIVHDFSDSVEEVKELVTPPKTSETFPSAVSPQPQITPPQVESHNQPRLFTEGLFRKNDTVANLDGPFNLDTSSLGENVWTRDRTTTVPNMQRSDSNSPQSPIPPVNRELGGLVEKAARLKMFEPGKSLVSKSMVKTVEGEVISEYFYSPLHPREGRQYIFNSLSAVWSLLALKARDIEAFQDRIETVFTDLVSRLDHSQNIHMESFLTEEISKNLMNKILMAPRESRPGLFEAMANRILNRIESIGPGRAGLIGHQFRQMPKPEFPPKAGLVA